MTLHPQAQTFVALLRELQPPRWEDLGVAKARRGFSALVDSFGAGPTMASVEDRIVEEQNCDGEVLRVPVRIYRPDGVSELAPVVMFGRDQSSCEAWFFLGPRCESSGGHG